MHRYLYANASPAVFTDPDGRVAVIQGGEVKRLQAAADESKGIVGLSEGITSLIRARGQSDLIGSEVRTYRRGHPIYDESLSSAGVKTVVQSISNAIGGDHSASALIVVEDDDTPETVLNFTRDFVGDTDSVITEYVLKNLVKNGVEAGQILDISLEFNAGLASANRRIEDLFLSEVANVSTDLRNSSGFNNIVFFASDLIVQQTAQIATDITITDLNPTTPRAPAVLADQANFNLAVEVALSLSPLTRGLFRTRAPATEASGNVYDPDFIGPVQWEYFYRGDATPRSNFLSAMSQRDGSEATDSFIDSLSGGARSEILSEHGVSSISSPFISTSKNPKVAQYFAGGPDQSQNGYLTTFRIEAREVKRLRDQGQIVPNFENPMSFFEPNLDIGVPEAEFLFLNSIEERYIYEQTPVRRK